MGNPGAATATSIRQYAKKLGVPADIRGEPPDPAHPALAMSVICLDLTRVVDEVGALERPGVSRLHVDFTEPGFGGGWALPLELADDLRNATALPVDAHVMLDHPERFLLATVRSG